MKSYGSDVAESSRNLSSYLNNLITSRSWSDYFGTLNLIWKFCSIQEILDEETVNVGEFHQPFTWKQLSYPIPAAGNSWMATP